MHATPVAGHMSECKTLYRIRLRLFWPRMRTDIKEWIHQCPHCVLTYCWRRRGQELIFSWTVSSPFAILHVDLWIPGHHIDEYGNMALMNSMCDMSQFVVVVPVLDDSSATLASYFMQHVIMKLDLYHLVVLDTGTPFKGVFIAMCQALNINYDLLAKWSHKGLSVEYFRRFLNKSVPIAAEERGTTNIFVPDGIAAGYAWNSAPINGTDILRSIPAIGRELKLPLDINLNAMPKLVQNNANAALEYLKLTDSSRSFSSSILKILIEDPRISHTERINNFRNLVVLHAGDIVMARTAIQSDLSKHKAAKLSYSVRGPFQIIRNAEFDSYFVRKLNKPDSS